MEFQQKATSRSRSVPRVPSRNQTGTRRGAVTSRKAPLYTSPKYFANQLKREGAIPSVVVLEGFRGLLSPEVYSRREVELRKLTLETLMQLKNPGVAPEDVLARAFKRAKALSI
jgi:hypothetical protein